MRERFRARDRYWALVTITSVGYGDICPENPSEMRWCMVLILLGAFLWAYIIGNACGIASSLDVDNIRHHQVRLGRWVRGRRRGS